MNRMFSTTLRISIALALITVSLVLTAGALGLMPNERQAELDARAELTQTLAVQLAIASYGNEFDTIKQALPRIIDRSRGMLSIGVRRKGGQILVESAKHGDYWQEPKDGKSTATHVQVPLFTANSDWGRVEFAFAPSATSVEYFGLSTKALALLGFIGCGGLVAFYLILRRTLRELDPGRAIPARVNAAFDTLSEGVMIMDTEERLLMVNSAFATSTGTVFAAVVGTKASSLPWLQLEAEGKSAELPWQVALRSEQLVSNTSLGFRRASGDLHRFIVSASRILDSKGVVRGVIASIHDYTDLYQKTEELQRINQKLHASGALVERQNQQLQYLASHDPLTGSYNRRSFFAELDSRIAVSRNRPNSGCLFMLDLDHFKSLNDRYGHNVGDNVLVGFVEALKSFFTDSDALVGRYGGEEFCIFCSATANEGIEQLARRLYSSVAVHSGSWLPDGGQVTFSAGIALIGKEPVDGKSLVIQADRALYAAKAAGRNRFIVWDAISNADLPKSIAC